MRTFYLVAFVCLAIPCFGQRGHIWVSGDCLPDKWTKILDTVYVKNGERPSCPDGSKACNMLWEDKHLSKDATMKYYWCWYDYGQPPPEYFELAKIFFRSNGIPVFIDTCRGWTVRMEEVWTVYGDEFLGLYNIECVTTEENARSHPSAFRYELNIHSGEDFRLNISSKGFK